MLSGSSGVDVCIVTIRQTESYTYTYKQIYLLLYLTCLCTNNSTMRKNGDDKENMNYDYVM